MPPDQTDSWLEALAARENAPTPDMEHEIKVMRNYYLRTENVPEPLDAIAQQARHARMRQWLEDRGAFTSAGTPVVSADKTGMMPARITARFAANNAWYAAAAAVFLAVFAIPLVQNLLSEQTGTDASTMRGAQTIQTIATSNPATTASQLESALAGFGVPVRRVDQDRGIRLETRIPENDIPSARALLAPYEVTVPDNGILIIHLEHQP